LSATSSPRMNRDLRIPVVCRDEGSIAIPPNPLPSSAPLALLLRRYFPSSRSPFPLSLTLLDSTLMRSLVSVANKELTGSLSFLESTLTEKRGWGSVIVN
jgi:hypothetical protein